MEIRRGRPPCRPPPKFPPPGCESIAEMPQVSDQTLPPGGSWQKSALRNRFLTDEECGRQPYDSEKSEDLLLRFGLGGGLFVYTDFWLSAHIPHPALRATLPPGEGFGEEIPLAGTVCSADGQIIPSGRRCTRWPRRCRPPGGGGRSARWSGPGGAGGHRPPPAGGPFQKYPR